MELRTKNWLGIRTKLSENEVREIIKELGINLPDDYYKYIGDINGGALKSGLYKDPRLGIISYSRNVNLSNKVKGNAIELYRILRSEGKELFPFGSVGNGDYFCFDLNKSNRVVLYVHESDKIYLICNSYIDFMNSVYEN